MRSISETVNYMVKGRFGAPIRKRLNPRKATETKLKNVAHNVRRIGYLEIIDGIIPHWPCRGISEFCPKANQDEINIYM